MKYDFRAERAEARQTELERRVKDAERYLDSLRANEDKRRDEMRRLKAFIAKHIL